MRRSLRYAPTLAAKLRKRDFRRFVDHPHQRRKPASTDELFGDDQRAQKQSIEVNLADLAVNDAAGFAKLAELAKAAK